jgi:hypothetical protein
MMILTSFLTVVFPAGFAMEIPVLVRARYLEADEIEAARRIDRIAAPRAEWDNAKCHDSVPFLRTVFFSVGARPILGWFSLRTAAASKRWPRNFRSSSAE